MRPSIFGNLPLNRKILLLSASAAGSALLLFSILSVLNFSYILPRENINHFGTSVVLMVLSFFASLGGALIVAAKLQKNITQPMVALADSARQVVGQGDYSIRAESSTKDEIGDLITNFNLILEVIQLRDEQLKEHKKNLDFLVGQKTEQFLRRQDDATAEPIAKNEFSTKIRHERRTPLSRLVDNHMSRIFSDSTPDVQLIGKALMVDDEPINRKVVVEILHKFGLEMDVAENGIEAIQMIEANCYSLVLMDIHMPEMSGFEAAEGIRALEKRSERERATIIAMTADVKETTRKKCFGVGMDDFISKPVKPEILVECIAHWLGAGKDKTSSPVAEGDQQPPRNMPEQGLWNRKRALDFVGGDEALFLEIATVFISRNELLLQNIAAAIEHRNADDLLETAHAYKGAIGYFASEVLRKSAMALENMAHKGQVDGVDVHLTQLQANSRLLCNDLYQMALETKSR